VKKKKKKKNKVKKKKKKKKKFRYDVYYVVRWSSVKYKIIKQRSYITSFENR